MNADLLTMSERLLAAAVNGVLQGMLLTGLVAVSLWAFGRANAATRHVIWFCTLQLVAFLAVAHFWIALFPPAQQASTTQTAVSPLDRVPEWIHTDGNVTLGPDADAARGLPVIAPVGQAESSDILVRFEPELIPSGPAASGTSVGPLNRVFPSHLQPTETIQGHSTDADVAVPAAPPPDESRRWSWLIHRLLNPASLDLGMGSLIPRVLGAAFLVAWVSLAGINVGALCLGLFRIRKLKRSAVPPSPELNDRFRDLVDRLEVNRRVRLKVSPVHRTSILLGFLDPIVLLPAEAGLEPEETELVLRHELAHVRRRDDWANLVQRLILAMLPFHPAMLWISNQITLEREIACDDEVLDQRGQPRAYALLLATLAARLQTRSLSLAPGASNNKTQLHERIHMILNRNRNTSPRLANASLAFITSSAAILAIVIVGSMPRIVFAQEETESLESPSSNELVVTSADGLEVISTPSSDTDVTARVVLTPPAISPGPKFKPADNISHANAHSHDVLALPAPVANAHPHVFSASSLDAVPVVAAVTVQAPVSPSAPRAIRAQPQEASVEKRLARLERMVESLMAEPGSTTGITLPGSEGLTYSDAIKHYQEHPDRYVRVQTADSKEIEKAIERTYRDARRIEEAARASAEARSKDAARELRLKEDSANQLNALRQQLEALTVQREALRLQIQELEQRQERLSDQLVLSEQLMKEAREEAGKNTRRKEAVGEPPANNPFR